MVSIGDFVDARAATASEMVAFLDGASGASITWSDLARVSEAWRSTMATSNLEPGDRIAVVAEDPLTFAGAYLAGIASGATVVPIDPRTPARSIEATLARCRASVVASDRADVVACSPHSNPDVGRWMLDRKGPIAVLAARPETPRDGLADHPAVLLTSSGTTGRPKGIPLTEQHLLLAAQRIVGHHEFTEGDRGYSSLPTFHVNAQVVGVISTLVSGGSLILDRAFVRDEYWHRVESLRATWVNAVPAILAALTALAAPGRASSTVRFVRSASAPLPADVSRAFTEHTGIGVLETFGMTEAASQITANPLDASARRPGSVGRAVGIDLAILDDTGRPLSAGESGRIVVSGDGVVTHYLDLSTERPETVRPARDRDGWLDTGDLGTIDGDGFLVIEGRSDDVINRGGEKFHPRIVEAALESHPSVTAAAVVAKPDPGLGSVPVAFVTVVNGPSAGLRDGLIEWCHGRVPRYQCPVEVRVVDTLAKGPTGKVLRRSLRAELVDEPEKATLSRPRTHIDALDVVRISAVALVIGVHTLAFGSGRLTEPVGAFVTIFHSSREIFFLLTAFALMHAYGRRPVLWREFWRRRYLLVVVPYLAWSAIYFGIHRRHFDPIGATAAKFGRELLVGGAQYHLYFLLVSMEIYLTFPLIRWVVRRTAGHHGALLVAAGTYQVAVTVAIEHHVAPPGLVGTWLAHPDPWLPSYLLYVLAGAIAAWHLDALTILVRRHARATIAAAAVVVGAGIGIYIAHVASGMTPGSASAVFQPVVVAESLALALALFAAGQWWADHGTPMRRLVRAGADGSFGIFLAHPLVLQVVLSLAASAGVLAAVRRAPAAIEIGILLLVAVPLVYGLSGALTALARRTPCSLLLTGRRSRLARPVVAKGATVPRPVGAMRTAPLPAVAPTAHTSPIHQEA